MEEIEGLKHIHFISFSYLLNLLQGNTTHSIVVHQRTRHINPALAQCWPTVYDADPTLNQHCVNALCLLMWCTLPIRLTSVQGVVCLPHIWPVSLKINSYACLFCLCVCLYHRPILSNSVACMEKAGGKRGAMVRTWRFACRAVSNPAWCRIFR